VIAATIRLSFTKTPHEAILVHVTRCLCMLLISHALLILARRERQTEELAPQSQVTSFLMYDWEGCTTGTIGLPNPNQP
jgi:hypothetical protein